MNPFLDDSVTVAHQRIAPYIRRTPLSRTQIGGADVWFKHEYLQHTGSFKTRGALNRVLAARSSGELTDAGVVCASGGNAGLAYAYAGKRLGIATTVFVPSIAPAVKVDALLRLGADVRIVGSEFAESYVSAMDFTSKTGATFGHPYDQPEMVAGAATMTAEIIEDVDDLDAVFIAVGGGGLVGGAMLAAPAGTTVVAVEPRMCSALNNALIAGEPVDGPVGGVAADSLGARRIGSIAFDLARQHHPQAIVVEEHEIVAAREFLWREYRVVVEHAAATAVAGLLSGAFVTEPGARIAVALCGANTDLSTLVESAVQR
ncbi:threonine dehydratase [Rhodococcus sp. 27YEA15]|uniref:threonine/serine dehydratase n=1 Tax=Rhodococcus sp. 27YEA15 TaxID=3156259 RepID=UPI003C7D21ED